MKKTTLLALVVLAGMTALVGCGGHYHGDTTNTTSTTALPETR